MIHIRIYRDADCNIIRVRCKGHAEYAEPGHDIICSAVSVLIINAVNSIEKLTDTKITYKTEEKAGVIDFSINGEIDDKAVVLLRSLELGLLGIRQDYGNRFINISNKEV